MRGGRALTKFFGTFSEVHFWSNFGGGDYFRMMFMIPPISVPVLYLRVKMIIIP